MEFLCLVGTLGEDATNALLLPPVRLHGLRSMACCCHTLAAIVRAHYSSPHFCVGDADASLELAMFAAGLSRATLRIEGDQHMPVLECARYRSLTRLKVGAMGTTAALYFGAVVADCNCTVRLANGNACKDLKPLRESASISLRGGTLGSERGELSATDLAALLGALSLNQRLTKLDLSGNSLGSACVPRVLELLAHGMIQSVGQHGLNLEGNQLGDEGWGAIFAGICGNKDSKIMSMDVSMENIGPAGSKLIAEALRTSVTGVLTVVNLLGNRFYVKSAKMLAKVAKQKGISLCGIRRDQTTAGFSGQSLDLPHAILLASDLSQAVVTGGLTSINLSGNHLCGIWEDVYGQQGTYTAEGITAIADALRVNGGLTSLDLSNNALCGLVQGPIGGVFGTYSEEGITAIAEALRVNGGLTALNLSSNSLLDEGVSAVCKAIQSNKETKLASLNFGNNGIGPVGAKSVAAMVAVTGALTECDLRNNSSMGEEAQASIRNSVQGKAWFTLFGD